MALIRNLRVAMASALALAIVCLGPAPGDAQQANAPPERVSGPEISTLIRSTVLAARKLPWLADHVIENDGTIRGRIELGS